MFYYCLGGNVTKKQVHEMVDIIRTRAKGGKMMTFERFQDELIFEKDVKGFYEYLNKNRIPYRFRLLKDDPFVLVVITHPKNKDKPHCDQFRCDHTGRPTMDLLEFSKKMHEWSNPKNIDTYKSDAEILEEIEEMITCYKLPEFTIEGKTLEQRVDNSKPSGNNNKKKKKK